MNKIVRNYTYAELAEIKVRIIYLNLMKKYTNVKPLLERSLHLLMLFFMADLEEEVLETFLKATNDLVEVYR